MKLPGGDREDYLIGRLLTLVKCITKSKEKGEEEAD